MGHWASIDEDTWKKHYETLLNESRAKFMAKEGNAQEDCKTDHMQVKEEEVRAAIGRAKSGTAPEPGGLYMKMSLNAIRIKFHNNVEEDQAGPQVADSGLALPDHKRQAPTVWGRVVSGAAILKNTPESPKTATVTR
ncbi:unnamed protein product [Nezara viridula]|uniref:Uncharacterized protein n=1 Tax=Nezara viridula TaxID=85310 RepID=A0A9P0EBK0_NEZVI|nr:unnamed protein product [Nezara viridula]